MWKKINLIYKKMKKILFSLLVLAGVTATAQVKVGNNPTTLATDANFQVEGTTTANQFVVLKNGNVGIGITAPNTSSLLEVSSTTQGFLPPRMTTAQRNAIASPAKGLIVYDTDLDCLMVNKGTPATPAWECIGGRWTTADLAPITSTGSSTLISGTSIKTVMSFNTNAFQTVTAPPGATTMLVKVWGAGGGKGADDVSIGGNGGGGAFSTVSTSISGGTNFFVFVANNGTAGANGTSSGSGAGGWGLCSGGAGGASGATGGSGGGAGGGGSSAVTFTSGISIAVAAGGGGGAGAGSNGVSGGSSGGGGGQAGFTRTSSLPGGGAGANGTCTGGTGQSAGGGDGPGAGGGGGGHTAGGAGGTAVPAIDQMAGGGGGGNSLGTVTVGAADVPGNSSDTDRISNAGNGQTNSGAAGKGLVVIYWSK
jgi:hypothetical protein